MKYIFTVLALATLSLSSAAMAADPTSNVTHDDFGGAYFTAATPDALSEGGDDMMFSAEALSSIEPAAGGDAGFILPEDVADEGASVVDGDRLPVPDEAIVPGME